jgi:hypothetical protein
VSFSDHAPQKTGYSAGLDSKPSKRYRSCSRQNELDNNSLNLYTPLRLKLRRF